MKLSLLIIHILCGSSALCCAGGAMFAIKGQPTHRLFGKYFFYAMTGVFITAIPLSLLIKNLFLFLIAIFSYYLAFTGWRYANNPSGEAKYYDWFISSTMLIASICMLYFSFQMQGFYATVLLIFGVIGLVSSLGDMKVYRNHTATGRVRIVKHLGAMLGATIAAITAFLVTNFSFQPTIVLWLAPTIILVPVILWWKNRVLKGRMIIS